MAQETWNRNPFASPDGVPPAMHAVVLRVLEAMADHPEIRRVRRIAQEELRPAAGQRLLDAGCGLGEVARALAAEVGRDGCVVALDLSAATVAAAAARHDGSAVDYVAGDVAALDLPDGHFDGVRSERVLQHVADPDAVIAELLRVTRPGGRMCLIDTDWESLAFDGMPDELTARVSGHLARKADRDHRPSDHRPSMGRTLRGRLVRAGLADISATPVTLQFTDPASAAPVLPMINRDVPPEADMIPADLAGEWFAAVDAAAHRGDFLAVLTIWVVAGTRPGAPS